MRNTNDDLMMMQAPTYWPKWPVLPIKNGKDRKPGQLPRVGVLIEVGLASDQTKPDIRFLADKNMLDRITFEEVRSAPKADPEQLVAEGWVVD